MVDSSGTGNHGTDEVNSVQTGPDQRKLSFDHLDRDVLISTTRAFGSQPT
jgi:hypothetical protein